MDVLHDFRGRLSRLTTNMSLTCHQTIVCELCNVQCALEGVASLRAIQTCQQAFLSQAGVAGQINFIYS